MELLPNLLECSINSNNIKDVKSLISRGMRVKSWYNNSITYQLCHILITSGHKVTIDNLIESIKYRPDLVCLLLPCVESSLTCEVLEKACEYMNLHVIEACISSGLKVNDKVHIYMEKLPEDIKIMISRYIN